MPGTFSVPARRPPSWWPPSMNGASRRALADVEHADALGGVQLVAGEAQQVDRALAESSIGILPTAWTASVWKTMPLRGDDLGDLLDGEDHAGLVVGLHDRDDGGVVVELVLAARSRSRRPCLSTPQLGRRW